MNRYGDYYATLKEAELLKIATDSTSLVEDAQQALSAELARRGLCDIEVKEFADFKAERPEAGRFSDLSDAELLRVAKEPEGLLDEMRSELVYELQIRKLNMPSPLAALAHTTIPLPRTSPSALTRRRPFGVKVLAFLQLIQLATVSLITEKAPIAMAILVAFVIALAIGLWTLQRWARPVARFCYAINALGFGAMLLDCMYSVLLLHVDCDPAIGIRSICGLILSAFIFSYLGNAEVKNAFSQTIRTV